MENQTYVGYYMQFSDKYTGELNKYGGLPTHLPTQWPSDEQFGGWTFLCQFYCDGKMLSIPDTLCIQIYQLMINDMESCDITVIRVPLDAKENTEKYGVSAAKIPEGDILFKEIVEEITDKSDLELEDKNGVFLQRSKLGGWCPAAEEMGDRKFLGIVGDGDAYSPFNWGGVDLFMFLNESNNVDCEFY